MKLLSVVLTAATLAVGCVAPAMAESDSTSMTNLWIATRDPAYAKLAGLSDKQVAEMKALHYETLNLQ
jgi:hypothetical protein